MLLKLITLPTARIVIQTNIHATKTTMCLVPINEHSSSRACNVTAMLRTLKTMQAAVLGIPMVNTSWILKCKRAKHISDPDPGLFIRSLPTKRTDALTNFGVAYLSAAMMALVPTAKYSPFVDLCFFLCGFKQTDEANFHELLRAAGVDKFLNKTSLVSSIQTHASTHLFVGKRFHYKYVMLCGESATIAISKAVQNAVELSAVGVAVVGIQWLVDSVSAGKPLPAGDYPPLASSKAARQLWKITKDKSFANESTK
jgi:hypothetical protein